MSQTSRTLTVVALGGFLAGCAAQLQYTVDPWIYDSMPNRPVVVVCPFADVRKDKAVGNFGGMYRLEPVSDVGAALQEQVARALYESKYNVIVVDESQAIGKDLRAILEEHGADMVIRGTIRNFQIRAPNGAMFPAEVISRLTIATLVHGEKDSQDLEVLVTGSPQTGMVLYLGSTHHTGFDKLYRQALEMVAAGVVDDPQIKQRLETLSGAKHT